MKERKFAVVESKFEYKGHECIVVFTMLGYRCGYVSYEPKDGVEDYFDIDDKYNFACNGGLTFSGQVLEDYQPSKDFYIGFDCGHAWNGYDREMAYKYGLIASEEELESMPKYLHFCDLHIVTTSEVEQQCKEMVDRIIDMDKESDK